MISALDVSPLVGHHVLHGVLVQIEGKINARVNQPQHKGGEDCLALIQIVLQLYRCVHPPLQAQIAHGTPT